MVPFEQINLTNGFLRIFSSNVNTEELYWHKDKEDRKVEVISGEGWMFQKDNHLPVKLYPGDKFEIEKNTFHRIIKGNSNLIVYIEEDKCPTELEKLNVKDRMEKAENTF